MFLPCAQQTPWTCPAKACPKVPSPSFGWWWEVDIGTGGSDGFVIGESLPGQFQCLVETVIPILQRRGSFRQEYPGSTFRENLGLDVPENRYTKAKRQREVA
ncbi:MAG TPA: hypothetical protein VHM25_11640 [Polyangiaceae bacterium]|nr:hypothetical protein [Polyangiaceae bacterium]